MDEGVSLYWVNRGNARYELSKVKEAILDYEKAVEIDA